MLQSLTIALTLLALTPGTCRYDPGPPYPGGAVMLSPASPPAQIDPIVELLYRRQPPPLVRTPLPGAVLVPPLPPRHPVVVDTDLPFIDPPDPRGRGVCFRMGSALLDREVPFYFSTEYTRVHMAVLGESGSGKSKFL